MAEREARELSCFGTSVLSDRVDHSISKFPVALLILKLISHPCAPFASTIDARQHSRERELETRRAVVIQAVFTGGNSQSSQSIITFNTFCLRDFNYPQDMR